MKGPDRMLSSVTVRSLATGMLYTGGQSDYCWSSLEEKLQRKIQVTVMIYLFSLFLEELLVKFCDVQIQNVHKNSRTEP